MKKQIIIISMIIIVILLIVCILINIKISNTEYEIIFDSNGGTTIENQVVMGWEKIEQPANPVKEYYNFDGWTINDKKYDFNKRVTKKLTLVANWKEPSNYKDNAFNMQCHTKISIDIEERTKQAENISKGEKIVCDVTFETYAVDKINNFKYELNYGEGFNLINTEIIEEVEVNNNTYIFNLNKPTSYMESSMLFTFEVNEKANNTNLSISIDNINFKTISNTYYTNLSQKKEFTFNDNNTELIYNEYKNDAFILRCYEKNSIDNNNKWQLIKNVSNGDKMYCILDFETYAEDKIKVYEYKLKYGQGLNLIKNIGFKEAEINNNHYKIKFKEPESVSPDFENVYLFEVIDTTLPSELYVEVNNIKFTTINNENYYNLTKKYYIY